MRQIVINLAIVAAALAVAIVLGAGAQQAIRLLFPAFSGQRVGDTDMGSYLGIAAMAVAFFTYGYIAPRWLNHQFRLAWLLLPIAILYVAAMIQAPQLFSCNSQFPTFCAVMHSMFIVPLLASALGYMTHRTRSI